VKKIFEYIADYAGHIKNFDRNAKLFLIGQGLYLFANGVFWVFFNVYLKKGGLGEDVIGLANSARMWATVIFAIPVAILASKIGAKKAFIISFPAIIITFALSSLTLEPPLLLILLFVMGSGSMTLYAATNPFLMANSTEKDRHYLFSLSFSLFSFASVIGSLIGGLIPDLLVSGFGLTEFMSLRLTLVGVALFASLGIIPITMIEKKPRSEKPPKISLSLRNRDELKRMAKFPMLQLAIGLGAGFMVPFLSIYFSEFFELKASQIGYVFSIGSAMTGVATLITPLMVRKFGRLKAMLIPQTIAVPIILVIANSPWVLLTALAFWFRGALMNAGHPVFNQILMEETTENNRPIMNNITALAWNAGWAISVAISGMLIKNYGYKPSFYATFAMYSVYVVLAYILLHKYKDKQYRYPEETYLEKEVGLTIKMR